MIDPQELAYYKKEYPDFTEEDILDILEAVERDMEAEAKGENSQNFTKFLSKGKEQPEEPQDMKSSAMNRIFGK